LEEYNIIFTLRASKDFKKIQKDKAKLKQLKKLLDIITTQGPFATPPFYESLVGDLKGLYSRRLNIKDRLVYEVYEETHTIKILSILTHYDF